MTQGMKDALKGQGGGLQSTSTIIGDLAAGNETVSIRGNNSEKTTKSKDTSAGENNVEERKESSTKGGDQIVNKETGRVDHLGLGQ
ncbi:uncharacterized protein K489DRAFT_125492 [Dissoconium aciculare CBS 342.82]|uniref:Uncharacterized protein n=1 Tax=Dissoconium aciculare CBS 342.82 TaxID=1314786 RepID=A0A6J3MGI4_9PEZI|nr:uncharacterized protein K489DRAFT_125492 [Dissoconium aciculare CBS 342.82]KAF1826789.1 hypothetical protein K489DRAFT_125492 [Dissoconium aciculare CBS 342.82]